MFKLAVATVICGLVLKSLAARDAGYILVPLAIFASFQHLRLQWQANRLRKRPLLVMLAANFTLLAAMMLQIDFRFIDGCGWDTWRGVSVRMHWNDDWGCWRPVGLPGIALDVAFYIPFAFVWWRLAGIVKAAAEKRR